MSATRRNPRFLDGVEIPAAVDITHDGTAALASAEVVLVAVPTQHVRTVLEVMRGHLPAAVPLISLSKGLEQKTGMRPSQVLRQVCGEDHPVMVLTGPSHAEEVARGLPATVVLAGPEGTGVRRLQEKLSSGAFRIYSNRDQVGCELCAALKNVMALAAGIAEGLGFGDNAKAAILSRGIVEMARYGVAEGAEVHTFYGLAGVGDLAVTAFSRHGRNRAFGERIGRGETMDQILASTPKVAEGVWTSRVVRARAQEMGVDMPLCDAVCQVLFEGCPPLDVVRELMDRDPKAEEYGI
jgi:glycerol-3-phosphate dehydrogenase (NAD(P)+)